MQMFDTKMAGDIPLVKQSQTKTLKRKFVESDDRSKCELKRTKWDKDVKTPLKRKLSRKSEAAINAADNIVKSDKMCLNGKVKLNKSFNHKNQHLKDNHKTQKSGFDIKNINYQLKYGLRDLSVKIQKHGILPNGYVNCKKDFKPVTSQCISPGADVLSGKMDLSKQNSCLSFNQKCSNYMDSASADEFSNFLEKIMVVDSVECKKRHFKRANLKKYVIKRWGRYLIKRKKGKNNIASEIETLSTTESECTILRPPKESSWISPDEEPPVFSSESETGKTSPTVTSRQLDITSPTVTSRQLDITSPTVTSRQLDITSPTLTSRQLDVTSPTVTSSCLQDSLVPTDSEPTSSGSNAVESSELPAKCGASETNSEVLEVLDYEPEIEENCEPSLSSVVDETNDELHRTVHDAVKKLHSEMHDPENSSPSCADEVSNNDSCEAVQLANISSEAVNPISDASIFEECKNEKDEQDTVDLLLVNLENGENLSDAESERDYSFKRNRVSFSSYVHPLSEADTISDEGIATPERECENDQIENEEEIKNNSPEVPARNDRIEEAKPFAVSFPVDMYRGYCHSFIRTGKCAKVFCKYIHDTPVNIGNQVAIQDFRKSNEELILNIFKNFSEACESGVLDKALEDARTLFCCKPSHQIKTDTMEKLLKATIKYNKNDKLFNDCCNLLKDHNMLNAEVCSKYIISLKNYEPKEMFAVALRMFDLCGGERFRLHNDAVEELYNIFCLRRSRLDILLRWMGYSADMCNYPIKMNLVQEAITLTVNNVTGKDTRSYLKALCYLIELLSETQLNLLRVEDLKLLKSLMKSYNVRQNSICYKRISKLCEAQTPVHSNNPSTSETLHYSLEGQSMVSKNSTSPVMSDNIIHYIENNEWGKISQMYARSITKRDGRLLHIIHEKIASNPEKLYERFSNFTKAVIHNVTSFDKLPLTSQYVVGAIGSCLLLECHKNKDIATAFKILYKLHYHNIHYCYLQGSIDRAKELFSHPELLVRCVSSWDAALAAIDICLQKKGSPLEALKVVKGFDFSSDVFLPKSRQDKLKERRLVLFIEMTRMLLQQRTKDLDNCQEAVELMIDSVPPDSPECHLPHNILAGVKKICNIYFAECLNEKRMLKVEELWERIENLKFEVEIPSEIWRGLLVQYCKECREEKAREILDKCFFYGIYNFKMPDIGLKQRHIFLPSNLTQCEVDMIIHYILQKFFVLLEPMRKEFKFEEWFSLAFKCVESPLLNDGIPRIKSLQFVSKSITDATRRLRKTLEEKENLIVDEFQNTINISPDSLYKKFTEWKKSKLISPAAQWTQNRNFNWKNKENSPEINEAIASQKNFRSELEILDSIETDSQCSELPFYEEEEKEERGEEEEEEKDDDVIENSPKKQEVHQNMKKFTLSVPINKSPSKICTKHAKKLFRNFSNPSGQSVRTKIDFTETENISISLDTSSLKRNITTNTSPELNLSATNESQDNYSSVSDRKKLSTRASKTQIRTAKEVPIIRRDFKPPSCRKSNVIQLTPTMMDIKRVKKKFSASHSVSRSAVRNLDFSFKSPVPLRYASRRPSLDGTTSKSSSSERTPPYHQSSRHCSNVTYSPSKEKLKDFLKTQILMKYKGLNEYALQQQTNELLQRFLSENHLPEASLNDRRTLKLIMLFANKNI